MRLVSTDLVELRTAGTKQQQINATRQTHGGVKIFCLAMLSVLLSLTIADEPPPLPSPPTVTAFHQVGSAS